MKVRGDFALASGTSGTGNAPEQDVGTAFGLGDERGAPFVRADLELGGFVFGASGFAFEERGSGQLDASFGGLPPATPVESHMRLACARVSCAYGFEIGPVRLAPGLAMDVFDIDFRVQETALGNAEVIDELIGVPLLYLRADVDVGPVDVTAELGYLDTPEIDGSEVTCLDAELIASLELTSHLQLFGGYRLIDIDANGDTGSESFGVDVQVGGWVVGGGLRF